MRTITIGYPSGVIKVTLWEGTDDQESFPVIYPNSDKPYVKAYGKKYYLTEDEIRKLKDLQKLVREYKR